MVPSYFRQELIIRWMRICRIRVCVNNGCCKSSGRCRQFSFKVSLSSFKNPFQAPDSICFSILCILLAASVGPHLSASRCVRGQETSRCQQLIPTVPPTRGHKRRRFTKRSRFVRPIIKPRYIRKSESHQ